MLRNLSLRMRLALLSATVTACMAAVLTSMFLFGADRIFVRELQQQFTSRSGEIVLSVEPSKTYDSVHTGEFTVTLKKAGARFTVWGLTGLLLVILSGAGAAWLMAGRALRPLADLSDAIEGMDGNDFSPRVDAQGRRDEIGRLARSFNAMMDKVSASFERQRRFCASAAHELKTPLAAIQVNLEVLGLDREASASRMERFLSVVQSNTERMARLVEDLFRLTFDGCDGAREEIWLDEELAKAFEELAPLMREKGLKACLKAVPKIRLVGNRVMLGRAMGNLIENAVKYNQAGGSVSVEGAREGEDLVVRVSDTGIGIPAGDIPHIFEPFYRVDQSRSRAVGGAGLGLPLARDIVERHGGRIEVDSKPGEGTVFTVRFVAVP